MKNNFRKTKGLFAAFLAIIIGISIAAGADNHISYVNADEVVESNTSETGWIKEGYSSILYDDTNGLPTSEANAIAQTSDGFIWIGGYSGLTRYDGNDFYRFPASIGVASVVSLYVDKLDRLWIGTNDNGVALYQAGVFRFFGRDEGLVSGSVRSINEDGNGNIILGTTAGIAVITPELTLSMMSDENVKTEYVDRLSTALDGTVYAVSNSGKCFIIKDLKVTKIITGDELGISQIWSVNTDTTDADIIYLGQDTSGICSYRVSTGKVEKKYDVSPLEDINVIYSTSDGNKWICADNGIGYIDDRGNLQTIKNIPMTRSIDNMMVDYENNIWFVSSRQGVLKLADSIFHNLSMKTGLPEIVVNSVCVYDGKTYIGADNGLYIIDENENLIETELTERLEGVRIRAIKKDSKGNLLLCTYGEDALTIFDGVNVKTFSDKNGLFSNRVRTVKELSDGTLAVALSGGFHLIKDDKIIDSYDYESGMMNSEILSIEEGPNGEIYCGSDGDGIYIIDGGKIHKLGTTNGLSSEVILRIKKDPDRNVYWIITSNSIAYMENEMIHTLKNFPYSNNFDMYFGSNGKIWILSSNGIYVVKGDELKDDKENIEYTFYDKACGLPFSITANSRNYVDENGNLYLCGSGGVSTVNIHHLAETGNASKLAIPFVDVDDERINIVGDEVITIPANTKRFTVYAYALTYSMQNPHLSYYLEGFDDGETFVSKSEMQPVSYTNLKGGKYTFHFSVVDSNDGSVQQEITVNIVKEKKINEMPGFWSGVAIAFLMLLLLLVRLYTAKKTKELLQKQKENKIFVSQIIHAFAKAVDLKDSYTNGHSFRVAEYAALIAEKMGYSEDEVENVRNIGMLHDVGKLTVPVEILTKPGKLSDDEYNIMKNHSSNGYDILKEIEAAPELALGAGYHHERIDGKGYPSGMKGDEIPMIAQIIAVADTFDAMNSTRPYRKKMPMEDILAELKRVSGTQLNGEIVDILVGLIDEGKIEEKN